jgi:hypothetical protein
MADGKDKCEIFCRTLVSFFCYSFCYSFGNGVCFSLNFWRPALCLLCFCLSRFLWPLILPLPFTSFSSDHLPAPLNTAELKSLLEEAGVEASRSQSYADILLGQEYSTRQQLATLTRNELGDMKIAPGHRGIIVNYFGQSVSHITLQPSSFIAHHVRARPIAHHHRPPLIVHTHRTAIIEPHPSTTYWHPKLQQLVSINRKRFSFAMCTQICFLF